MATLTNNIFAKQLSDQFRIGVELEDGAPVALLGPSIQRVSVDPNGSVSDFAGSLALRTNGALYINTNDSTAWSQVAVPAGGGRATILRGALTTESTAFAAGTNTRQKFTGIQPAIPAAALTAGATIRVLISGVINRAVASNLTLEVFGNDALTGLLASTTQTDPANGSPFRLVTEVTLRANPPGDVEYSQILVNGLAVSNVISNTTTPFLAAQAAAITFCVTFSVANAGNNVDIRQFVVTSTAG